jgi:hypothetical protein
MEGVYHLEYCRVIKSKESKEKQWRKSLYFYFLSCKEWGYKYTRKNFETSLKGLSFKKWFIKIC